MKLAPGDSVLVTGRGALTERTVERFTDLGDHVVVVTTESHNELQLVDLCSRYRARGQALVVVAEKVEDVPESARCNLWDHLALGR